MPELKRVFNAGIMNRDLDDRLVPPGQYREALNINVGRSEGSDVGAVENVRGNDIINEQFAGTPDMQTIGAYRDNGNEHIYYFVTNNDSVDGTFGTSTSAIIEYDQVSNETTILLNESSLNFNVDNLIHSINLIDNLLFWTDDRNPPRKINVETARNDAGHYIPASGNEVDDLLSVAKYVPIEAPVIVSTGSVDPENGEEIASNFMEDKFIRFAYRWRFEDGELSVISPFTSIVFDSDIDSLDGSLQSEAINTGELRGFVNNIKAAVLEVQTPAGFGITEVELIYTEVGNTNLYVVESKPVSTQTEESFIYKSQDPFRTLPSDQLTRTYDAVPRLAGTQELAGSRLIYGNFLQNYNIPQINFTAGIDNDERHGRFQNYSVKSGRTYQVGIVLADRYGRQTPVILSGDGGDTVFVERGPFDDDATDPFKHLTILFDDVAQIPSWAHSYKVVVKQREQEYYNWFTNSGPNFVRNGDSINKIPIDQTVSGDDGVNRPSSAVVIPVIPDDNNSSYGVSIDTVDSTANVSGAPDLTNVFETEPFRSNLDIFFETSSGGLISDLGSTGSSNSINIRFFNCYLIQIGTSNDYIEANRLRLGFNEIAFNVGIRAYQVQENFAEERRFNTLIHSSGFFNSRTNLNQLNQFNEAEGGLTISLDPQDGSIQLVYAEDTQLVIFQEDKVSRSPIDKDFIFSAEGGAVPVTSSTQFLGTIAAYAGEYGISTDPGSFAIYGTRKYFTDKNRGVVIRLSQDGLTEISQAGMSDFFRDALRTSNRIQGSFDEYHNHYVLTITGDSYAGNEDTNIATSDDGYFTLTFDEDVKGWTAFKSFQQEEGLTLNNTYYTFNRGELWQHNLLTVPRNSFYGIARESYVDVIFNDAPSLVKEFKTIGYEGTDGWTCDYIDTDLNNIGDLPVVDDLVTNSISFNGLADNSSLSGLRSYSVTAGEIISWNVIIAPLSDQFEFNATTDVLLATVTPNVTIDAPSELFNGKIVYKITYTSTGVDTNIVLDVSGPGASSAIDINLLEIFLDSETANAVASPALTVYDVVETDADYSFTVTANDDNYIDDDVISIVSDDFELLDFTVERGTDAPVDDDDTFTWDDLRFSTTVDVTQSPQRFDLTVNGDAVRYGTLQWTLETPSSSPDLGTSDVLPGIDDFIINNSRVYTQTPDAFGISKHASADYRSAIVNIHAEDPGADTGLRVLVLNAPIADIPNVTNSVIRSIDSTEGLELDLDFTHAGVETNTAPSATIVVNYSNQPATLSYTGSGFNHFSASDSSAISYLGGTVTIPHTQIVSNVEYTVTSSDPNIGLSEDPLGNVSFTLPEITTGGEDAFVRRTITLENDWARININDTDINVTQAPRFYADQADLPPAAPTGVWDVLVEVAWPNVTPAIAAPTAPNNIPDNQGDGLELVIVGGVPPVATSPDGNYHYQQYRYQNDAGAATYTQEFTWDITFTGVDGTNTATTTVTREI